MTDKAESTYLKHIRPVHLLTALALYFTGAGLARYLGARIEGGILGLLLVWLTCLLEGFFLLGDYLERPFQGAVFPLPGDQQPREADPGKEISEVLLFSALALLAAAAVLTAFLISRNTVPAAVYWLMGGLFLTLAALVFPNLNLDESGLGEFGTSLALVIFPPAVAFLSQYGGFQRYLTLAVFPIFPLHLALILTLRLRSFPADLRRNRQTLLMRIGWVRGIFLHNLLLLSGFLLFGAALLFGLPLRIAGPVLIGLIPAGYLVWYYANLERGAPVRWPILVSIALMVFFLPVYLLLFSTWMF